MDNILVLGLIPGTDIAISFWAWMVLMVALAVALRVYGRRWLRVTQDELRQLGEYLDHYLSLYLDEYLAGRQRRPLHASQLHRRLPRPARQTARRVAALLEYIAAHHLTRRLTTR